MTFNLIETLAIAAMGLLAGKGLCRLFPVLHRLCLPEPVLGGLVFCLGFFGWSRFSGQELSFDLSLQTPFMIAFFLSIGWMASWRNLRAGGPEVFKFLLLCSVILLVQNGVGMILASLLGQQPLLGVLAGSVSLTGGPGTALAFAPAFEKAGIVGAGPIGTACALAGIVLGGLLGAPLSASLLRNLKPAATSSEASAATSSLSAMDTQALQSMGGAQAVVPEQTRWDGGALLVHLKFFLLVMALGSILGKWINDRGVTLPIYIGSMVVAATIRNFHDSREGRGSARFQLSGDAIEELGSICLSYFLVVATMTLKLAQLASLASILVVILVVQTIVVLVIARWAVFRFFGRDYDAAVMAGGFVGFMLGTTANAMANMNAVSDRFSARFGAASRAFVVVPLVGACFIDFVNAIVITFLTRG